MAGCKTSIPRKEKENHPLKSIPSSQGSASVWVAGSQAGLRAGWLSSCTSPTGATPLSLAADREPAEQSLVTLTAPCQEPRHWMRKAGQASSKFPWDWHFLWLVYCCLDTMKQLFCSRMGLLPHHSKIQRVPVQGLACCHHSLHAAQAGCSPAEGELYYGVTRAYFCTLFNTVVGPPSFFWDEKAPLRVPLAVFMLYVQNPCVPHMQSFLCCPFRRGRERRKVR